MARGSPEAESRSSGAAREPHIGDSCEPRAGSDGEFSTKPSVSAKGAQLNCVFPLWSAARIAAGPGVKRTRKDSRGRERLRAERPEPTPSGCCGGRARGNCAELTPPAVVDWVLVRVVSTARGDTATAPH